MAEKEESSGDLLRRMGTDGAKWAEEFQRIAKNLGYSEMDEGWLIGWFANAIETGKTAGRTEIHKIERKPWHDADRDTRKCTGL